MPYTDGDDISGRITAKTVVQLTDDEALARGVSLAIATTLADAIVLNAAIQTRIDQAIADADTTINTFIRKQAATPTLINTAVASTPANTPPTVRQASIQLSIFNLYGRRRGEFELPESVVANRDMTIRILKGINEGKIDIGDEPQPANSDVVLAEADTHATISDVSQFNAFTLKDF